MPHNRALGFLLFFLFAIAPVFAIEELGIEAKKDIILKTEINFEEALNKAKAHSFDLKIAAFETMISKTGIISARSEYFPKLTAMAGTEYTKNFRDYSTSSVTTVGDAFINPYTRFQSVLGITLSYNVFDFGLRKSRLDLAKEDVNLKKLLEKQALQELQLNFVDTYAKALILKKQIDILYEIYLLENKNLSLIQRLYAAKEAGLTELNAQKVKTLAAKKQADEVEQLLSESVEWLSFYTGQKYDIKNLKIKDIKDNGFKPFEVTDYTQSLVWKIYDLELKKKELELSVVRKNNYPKINAYGKYYLYGSDYSSYNDSLGDIEPSSLSVGGNILIPVFDGLQNKASVEKVKLELQQAGIKRDKALAEWMTRLAILKSNHFYLTEQIKENEKIIEELSKKADSETRLLSNRAISPLELNNTKIELLKEKNELEKNRATMISVLKGIEILTLSENEL